MKLEKGVISSSQLMFLVAGFMQGSVLLGAFAVNISKQDMWLVVLLGWVVSLPIILIFLALALKFPGKNLIQINDIIYGPYLGKLVSALYVWYFLSVASFNLWNVGEFVISYLMPETRSVVILIMFTFICVWGVRSGIEVISRISVIFVVFTLLETILTFVFLIKDMKFTNFLPVFEIPLKNLIHGIHIMVAIPFCEIFIFMMVIPYVNKIKQVKRATLLGFGIGGVTLLITTIQNTTILGNTATIMSSPTYEAVRLIDIAGIITRLEVLVAIVLLITMFLKVSVFFYVSVLGIAQIFRLRSYVPLVLPIAIIIISLSMLVFNSHMENMAWGNAIAATYATTFELLIPLMSLLIAKIRRLPKKQEG